MEIGLKLWIISWLLTVPRILGAFIVLPFFGASVLPGMVRNGIVVALSVVIVPLTAEQLGQAPLELTGIIILILKEFMLGFILGFVFSIPFWAVSAAGYFIDMQRGTMSAELFFPLLSDRTSPLGALFSQMMVTLLFSTGGFLLMFEVLALSYKSWPVHTFFPMFNMETVDVILQQFDLLMYIMLLLSGPIIAIMFLVELGAALIGRNIPELNIFLLLMPIKSGLAFFILSLYIIFIARYIQNGFLSFGESFRIVDALLK